MTTVTIQRIQLLIDLYAEQLQREPDNQFVADRLAALKTKLAELTGQVPA